MTGFTLGAPSGTTLGGDSGGTLGTAPRQWTLDGVTLSDARAIAETVTPETISLTWRVTNATLLDYLRGLKRNEGKAAVLGKDTGGFVAVGRADGGNTFALSPPDRRKPLRAPRTVHVQRYEESLVSQDGDTWDVELEFAVDENRTDRETIAQGGSGSDWGITTRYGTIATERVDADVLGTGEGGVKRFELTARLTFKQAHSFEAGLARIGGGRVRAVPDAPNVAVDDTSDDAATINLRTPTSQTAVADGDYVVTDWDSSMLRTGAYQEVTFTVAKK